jgi:hypothetical protein
MSITKGEKVMYKTSISSIQEVRSVIGTFIVEEEAVLVEAIKSTGGTLSKGYGINIIDESGKYCNTWSIADVWITIDKKHVALAIKNEKLSVRLVKYFKTGKVFEVQLLGIAWANCRNMVHLDEVLQVINAEMQKKTTQISANTSKLLESLNQQVEATVKLSH